MATAAKSKTKTQAAPTGKISQVIGAVVDVTFEGELPAIFRHWKPRTTAAASFSKLPSTSVKTPSARSRWTRPTV